MNSFSAYEEAALSTAVYPNQGEPLGLVYVTLKASGEAGEFAGHFLEAGGVKLMAKEVGDELWYVAAKARELGRCLFELLGTDNIDEFETTSVNGEAMSIGALGLYGTKYAGDFSEQLGKAMRDDQFGQFRELPVVGDPIYRECELVALTPERREKLLGILVDHAKNLALKAYAIGTPLSVIAAENVAKLQDRKARGVLGGSGDNR
jgi:hypothetical protein